MEIHHRNEMNKRAEEKPIQRKSHSHWAIQSAKSPAAEFIGRLAFNHMFAYFRHRDPFLGEKAFIDFLPYNTLCQLPSMQRAIHSLAETGENNRWALREHAHHQFIDFSSSRPTTTTTTGFIAGIYFVCESVCHRKIISRHICHLIRPCWIEIIKISTDSDIAVNHQSQLVSSRMWFSSENFRNIPTTLSIQSIDDHSFGDDIVLLSSWQWYSFAKPMVNWKLSWVPFRVQLSVPWLSLERSDIYPRSQPPPNRPKSVMDWTSVFLFCIISVVIGAVLMILLQYYAFVKYFHAADENPEHRQPSINEKYQLPDVSSTVGRSVHVNFQRHLVDCASSNRWHKKEASKRCRNAFASQLVEWHSFVVHVFPFDMHLESLLLAIGQLLFSFNFSRGFANLPVCDEALFIHILNSWASFSPSYVVDLVEWLNPKWTGRSEIGNRAKGLNFTVWQILQAMVQVLTPNLINVSFSSMR